MTLNRWLTDEERARAKANGIGTKTLYYRLYISDKWELEEALTAPPGTIRHEYEGENHKWLKLAKANGIKVKLFHQRRKLGWGHHKAATKPVRKKKVTSNEK